MRPQPGIFALGTVEHAFLELEARGSADDLVRAVAGLAVPLSTTGGVNVVVGFRPELWARVARDDVPERVSGWDAPLAGVEGFTMPATQHDAWVWIAGGDRTVVFERTRATLEALDPVAAAAGEVNGWVYRYDRDLTGFIDGTENPSLLEAPDVVAVPPGRPGAGSSVVLYQLWAHDSAAWGRLGTRGQELAMGRTKEDSIELPADAMPPDAHVARTSFAVDGEEQRIFRRNVAYGGATEHGTVFVGFSHDQRRLTEMLRRMAGAADGIRCALTSYLVPTSGAYYTVPSVEALAGVGPDA